MSDKKRILLIPSDLQGVGSFRSIWPSQSIQKHHSDEFEIELGIDIDVNNIEYLASFDIVHFHRQIGNDFSIFPELAKKLRDRGTILIMDIDDYWEPANTHPLYEIVKNEKLPEKIVNNLKHVDCVTTTTDIFKEYILKYNPNSYVIPNALDMTHKMWKSEAEENKSGKCRISFIGGSSHLHDLQLLSESMLRLNTSKELENKFQLVLCGFDIRGTITEIGPNNQQNVRPIQPQGSVWNDFERIFTSNHTLIKNPEYLEYLKRIKKDDFPGFENENYVRRWTLPLTQYGKHYDYCDVCLAPLQETETIKRLPDGSLVNPNDPRPGTISKRLHVFNQAKSELKIVESGMKKKVLIAQDFGIYKKLIKNGYNGILVSDNKHGWYKAMKEVILNPDLREKLSTNLNEFVKDKYELKNVTDNRVEFYKQIIKDKEDGKLAEFEKQRFLLNNKPVEVNKPNSLNNIFRAKPNNLIPQNGGGSKETLESIVMRAAMQKK